MEQKVLELADRLAFRAYAYRIFHVVFGAKPNSEVLAALRSAETSESLDATVYRLRRSDEGGGMLAVLEDEVSRLGEEACAELLGVEFDRLFNIPGSGYACPWASSYERGDNMIFRESTLEVRHAYAARGFQAKTKGRFPEDHVAMMLDFLGCLGLDAFDAFCQEDDAAARAVLGDQADFLERHFGEWLPQFAKKVEIGDRSGFYASAVKDLRFFVEDDRAFLAEALAQGW